MSLVRSRWMEGASGDRRRVVVVALLGNSALAIAKLSVAAISGSVALFASGVQSSADAAVQAMLLVESSPRGRAKPWFFWAFVLAFTSLFWGGLSALYAGIRDVLAQQHQHAAELGVVLVLLSAIAVQGASLWVGVREIRRSRGELPLRELLFGDWGAPVVPMVLLQGAGALIGVWVALIAVVTAWGTLSTIADGAGAIVIGILMLAVGVSTAHEAKIVLLHENVPENDAPPSSRRA